ncbi:maltose alpha-D-glucosyltransferase [bacterium]|nr:maltose alpha-D-glucosyltransferase [bacterium]
MENDPLWYKDAILYELHVKAFCDSNGDGIGDFKGLVEKLDYLQELGINCIWLLPFYESPLKDDGYDISDYRSILPEYGTMKDFKRFVREAHKRDIRVLLELVINHTSDQHVWFQEARLSKKSKKRDFYVWNDEPLKKYKDARIIFMDSENSNWAWDAHSKQYYWHRFFSHQPDLNYDNPIVCRTMLNILSFWLNTGVDGFRLDAVPYLFERDGTNCENLPETHEYLKSLRQHLDRKYKNKVLLAEANQWPEDVRPYFGEGDECNMAFHFPLMPRIFMALRKEDSQPIVEIMGKTPAIPENCQWAIFLRNHDELTLEMVTDDERDYMYTEYAKHPKAKLNLGIRHRLAPLMNKGRRQIELLHSILFTMPGSPIIYYGDELGMGDNVYLGDRNGVRTPMQWTGDRNAGFSKADTAQLYAPPIVDPVYGYQAINVEAQQRTPTSLLNWMKIFISTRKRHKAFGRGSLEFLKLNNNKVLAYFREYQDEVLLILNNLSRYSQPAEMDLSKYKGYTPVSLIGNVRFPKIGDLPYFITFGPHTFYWFRLEEPAIQKEADAPTVAKNESAPADKAIATATQAVEAAQEVIASMRKSKGGVRKERRKKLRTPQSEPAAEDVITKVAEAATKVVEAATHVVQATQETAVVIKEKSGPDKEQK